MSGDEMSVNQIHLLSIPLHFEFVFGENLIHSVSYTLQNNVRLAA